MDESGRHRVVAEEELFRRGTTLVRRLRLEPGEAMRWHRDPFHRVTVVLRGDALAIEAGDLGGVERFEVTPGQADWDEPSDRLHRAVNVGREPYEEIAVFFLDTPDAVAQPGES
jgi:quercetin dioxygenase-like cupin family protein